jgi:hypothetical protein
MTVSVLAANALYQFNPVRFLDMTPFGDRAEYISEWEGEPASLEKGSRVEIENRLGSVEITASKDGMLHASARIRARGATGERARTAAEARHVYVETGPVTRIYTRPDGEFAENKVSVGLLLEIPAGLNISVSNNMGGIKANNTAAESLLLENSLGSIEVDGHTGNLRAKNKMGEIKLQNINGDIDSEGSMGETVITGPEGNVAAQSRVGSIELSSAKPLDKKYVLKGESGEIIFRLPRNSNLKVEASTSLGGISGMETYRDGRGAGSRGEMTLGEGKGSAVLETKMGSIRVDTI